MPYFARPVAGERHAGHADIIRETLDGRRAGQLLEAYEAG
jgi:hypothetical protein